MNLKEKLLNIFPHKGVYDNAYFKINEISDGFELKIGAMYESPAAEITFAKLKELSNLFGTDIIDVDNWSQGGCETCDYGSDYGHSIQIKKPTKNVKALKSLIGLDLYQAQS